MNATSFTPGPWHVSNGKDVFAALGAPNAEGVCTESNDAWQIADCEHFMSYVGGYEYELSSVEQKANARLIAAAPELYEAAQDALDWIADSIQRNAPGVEQDDPPVAQLRAALAKARGDA